MEHPNLVSPPTRRSSVFTETGLEGHDPILDGKIRLERPRLSVRFRSHASFVEPKSYPSAVEGELTTQSRTQPAAFTQTFSWSQIPFSQILLLLALAAIAYPTFISHSTGSNIMPIVAEAGSVVPNTGTLKAISAKRQNSNTDVCKRWSGQSAVVNGTIYYYGGRATTSADQTTNEWSTFKIIPSLISGFCTIHILTRPCLFYQIVAN